jgi:DNA invertase Pin-like site-specific DNA recombinase
VKSGSPGGPHCALSLVTPTLTLRDSGVHFLAVDMPEANDLTVGIMALVAQTEREAISRRTKEAQAEARARGVKLGKTLKHAWPMQLTRTLVRLPAERLRVAHMSEIECHILPRERLTMATLISLL